MIPETKPCVRMVREVGFEPTNPYGTGASGLRVQDLDGVQVSLTWLGNTSHVQMWTPARSQIHPRKPTAAKQVPYWLSPPLQYRKPGNV